MWRYVAMQNLAPLVLDDEKLIQHSECGRGEEIEGSDCLAVILEKGETLPPESPRRTIRRRYLTRDRSGL